MKPSVQTYNTQVGNITPQSTTAFGIAAGAEEFVMDMLAGLYANRSLAMLREYTVNAIDSHKEAGNPAPVEVELPSSLRPVFVVRDHGLGMTIDEVQYFYTQYGASTKREANVATGMFGIGCKSAFAYTSQFTVIAVKNGVKVTALVRKNEQNKGVFEVIDTVVVDEPNGVEVQIPVKNVIEFNRQAETFFPFVDKGAVLVNGKPWASIFDTGTKLDDDIVVTDLVGSDTIVMGNVPYPLPYNTELSDNLGYRSHVVARVDIGFVMPAPPRESLVLTDPVTADTVQTIKRFVDDELVKRAKADVASAPTPHEASKRQYAWRSMIVNVADRVFTYHGDVVPNTTKIVGYLWTVGAYGKQSSRFTYMSNEKWTDEHTLVIVGCPNRSLTREEKNVVEERYPDATQVFTVHSMTYPQDIRWVDPARVVEYTDIKPVREPKERQPRKAPERVKYAKHLSGAGFISVEARDIDEAEVVYIVRSDNGHRPEWNKWTRDQYRKEVVTVLQRIDPEVAIVLLNLSEVERFCKLFPHAQTVPAYLQAKLTQVEAGLTDDAFSDVSLNHWLTRREDLADPEAVALKRRIEAVASVSEQLRLRTTLISYGNNGLVETTLVGVKGNSNLADEVKVWEKKYPMCDFTWTRDHTDQDEIDYINALYFHRNNR